MSQNEDPRSPMENAALALYYHAAGMIKEGYTSAEIEQQLMAQGLSKDAAQTILRRLSESRTNVTRQSGQRNIALGIAVVGLSIAAIIRVAGTDNLLALGFSILAAIFGAYWAVRGLQQSRIQ